MKKYKLKEKFTLSNDTMELFGIPLIEKIDNHDEIWSFVILDRHPEYNKRKKYIISSYGRLYNLERRIMCSSCDSGISISTGNYRQVSLRYDGKNYTYFVHRLVALAFIPRIKYKPFVNHKDCIPYHNYLWNLEWCNVSENMIHAINNGLKVEKRGEQRSNSIWMNSDIKIICSLMEKGHKATYIFNKLKTDFPDDERITYERIRTLYKHIVHKTHWTHISKDYDIDFSKYNYSKEKGSIQRKSNNFI